MRYPLVRISYPVWVLSSHSASVKELLSQRRSCCWLSWLNTFLSLFELNIKSFQCCYYIIFVRWGLTLTKLWLSYGTKPDIRSLMKDTCSVRLNWAIKGVSFCVCRTLRQSQLLKQRTLIQKGFLDGNMSLIKMDVFSLCRLFGSAQNKRPFTKRDLWVVRLLVDNGLVCSNGIGLSKCKICLEGRSGSSSKSTLRAAKLQVLPFWYSRCDLAAFLLPLLTLRINRRLTFFLLKSLTAGTFVIYTSRNVFKT